MDRVQAHRLFQALNHERIRRLHQLAPARHRLILELLPLLFHTNAKSLPGYVSDDTPAGLIDYRPDRSVLDRAQQLEKSFRFRPRALRRYPLRGMYLINPQSLLHYPEQAEFELWVLHATLPSSDQQLLQNKLDAIVQWSAESGLMLHARLLSETELEHETLSNWQREQLYSCGLVLAGSHPNWWQTTPDEDAEQALASREHQSARRVNATNLVDFGDVGAFEPTELLNLSKTTLKQSINKGRQLVGIHYLSACLASASPLSLSAELKRQIYQNNTTVECFDPDFLRLMLLPEPVPEAIYQAYYLNSGEVLSRSVHQAPVPWRRSFIQSLTEQWGWDDEQLETLDKQRAESSALAHSFDTEGQSVKALIGKLKSYCQTHQLNAEKDLHQLEQLYQLRHQPKLDQIPCLPLQYRPASNSERLYLTRFSDDNRWRISHNPLAKPSDTVLFAHESLLAVISYAVSSHILSRSNWLSVNDQHQRVSTASVVELSHQLSKIGLADIDLTADPLCLGNPETLGRVWFFINLETHIDNAAEQGVKLTSNLNDPLNYSSYQHTLIKSIDTLVISTYGCIYTHRSDGTDAPLETLRYVLTWPPAENPVCHSWCPTPIFGLAIQQRLNSLCRQAITLFQENNEAGALLLNVAGQAYSLQWQHQQVTYRQRSAKEDLWQSLSANERFRLLRLDHKLDNDGLLNTLLAYQHRERISVFVYFEHNTIICYLLDEYGNLLRQQYQHLSEATLIGHLHVFLSEIKHRNQIPHLRFYRLKRSQHDWQAIPLAAPSETKGYLPIKVTLSSDIPDAQCEVHCGQMTFSGPTNEPALFAQVHQLVLGLREQKQTYPIYLNSLLFDDDRYHPTSTYMIHKQRLETLFNQGTL